MNVTSIASLFEENIEINEQVRRLLDSPEVTIWYRNIIDETLFVSVGYASLYGYKQSDFITHPKLWIDSVYLEDRIMIESVISQQLKGLPTDIEYRIIRADGEIKWLRDRSTPIFNDEGKVIAIGGSIYDITEYKSAHVHLYNQLKVNEQKIELTETIRLQQGMTFKYKKVSNQFIHTLCDGELLYRLGLVPRDVVGKQLFNFLPTEEAQEKNNYYQRAWNGEENVTYEGEINGISYLAALSPIYRGGEVVEVIGSCIDITDRKKVEHDLLESESKYRLIAENMTDLIILFDLYGNGIYASPSHETILGYSPTYFETKDTKHLIHPEDLPTILYHFEQVIKTKTPSKVELRLLHSNGNWKLFECTGTAVIGENDLVEHIMVVAKDITDKRKAEELLWKSEKLSLVGELAAGVAHEIRNPLTSIKGFIQLFQQGVRKEEYFHVILNEFNRIEDIIKEFLSLAKPQEIRLKPASIPSLVKDITTLLESEAHLKNVEFLLKIEKEIPMIMCDANQIKQVLLNLCKNSIEAIDTKKDGFVTITVRFEDENILLIQVIDNGTGISEDRLKKLGEPFFSNKEKGTGLGLMLCYRIIKEHKGTITFESIENQGTTVNVRLPLVMGET
ncbi:PAS domain S-box protein [Ferdinandcohnia sp. Marseille-Q9671]